jgi:hypothetical protein
MRFSLKYLLFTVVFVFAGYFTTVAQQTKPFGLPDTSLLKTAVPDTGAKKIKVHSPKVALRRSAMIPGWGQVYNKQAWKVPIVYGALGITAAVFFNNVKWYNRTRYAFNIRAARDTPNFVNIHPRLQSLTKDDLSFYRKQFRRDVDYSVLFFIAAWGLNIADAVVFAHLKNFDVSDNLSININAGHNHFSNTTGLTLALDIHKKRQPAKMLLAR